MRIMNNLELENKLSKRDEFKLKKQGYQFKNNENN